MRTVRPSTKEKLAGQSQQDLVAAVFGWHSYVPSAEEKNIGQDMTRISPPVFWESHDLGPQNLSLYERKVQYTAHEYVPYVMTDSNERKF